VYNPLATDYHELTDTQLEKKIADLSRKYWMTQNLHVQQQMSTLIEMYKIEMRSRLARSKVQDQEKDNNSLDNLIKIS
jgi:hypothetical protein